MAGAAAGVAHTVLGPVPTSELGMVAVHEALLSVLPGAQYAYDIPMDRAEIHGILTAKLTAFRAAGGGAIVDATGMFHGRDLAMYESLSRATGVHIIASTGLGPEEKLGGYFLTPQTNPPTPWPAEKFTDLFTAEVTDGMVVPRLERRASAGLLVTAADRAGMTPTEESLFRAAARTARTTGIAASIRFGADPLHDVEVLLDEQLAADRIIVGDLDRSDSVATGAHLEIARRGCYVALDHIGWNDCSEFVDDARRVQLVRELVDAGHVDRILLSSSAIGVAKGQPECEIPYDYVRSTFIPRAVDAGLASTDVDRILIDNPQAVLAVRPAAKGA